MCVNIMLDTHPPSTYNDIFLVCYYSKLNTKYETKGSKQVARNKGEAQTSVIAAPIRAI